MRRLLEWWRTYNARKRFSTAEHHLHTIEQGVVTLDRLCASVHRLERELKVTEEDGHHMYVLPAGNSRWERVKRYSWDVSSLLDEISGTKEPGAAAAISTAVDAYYESFNRSGATLSQHRLAREELTVAFTLCRDLYTPLFDDVRLQFLQAREVEHDRPQDPATGKEAYRVLSGIHLTAEFNREALIGVLTHVRDGTVPMQQVYREPARVRR